MSYILRCSGFVVAVFSLGEATSSGENVRQPAKEADSGFVLRANKVIATDGEPVLLKLTLIYTGDKPLRIDYPIDGVCQPGKGQPPWVWIDAPAGWKDRQEAFRKAFPDQINSLHSGSITLKRGDKFSASIPLTERFSQIPLGLSMIQVTWPVFGDPFAPNWSPHPLATPTVTVPIVLNPRIVRKEPHDSNAAGTKEEK